MLNHQYIFLKRILEVTLAKKAFMEELNVLLIGDQLCSLIIDGGYAQLRLNFQNVDHLPDIFIGRLDHLRKVAAAANGEIVLCHVRPSVYEELRRKNYHQHFRIEPPALADNPVASISA